MALGLGIILGHQSGVTSRRASCNQVSRVISRQPLSVFKLLAGVLWRQAFAKDLGFEHMFERRRLARMADSGGGGGAGKGRKKPTSSPTTIASSSSSSLEHFLLFPVVYRFHHPLRRQHDSFSGDRIRLGPHQNTPALKANCFLPFTQESVAFSLQLVSFWHTVYRGPLSSYPLPQKNTQRKPYSTSVWEHIAGTTPTPTGKDNCWQTTAERKYGYKYWINLSSLKQTPKR